MVRAVLTEKPGTEPDVSDIHLRPPDATEVVVSLEAASLCRSDLKPLDGDGPASGWPLVSGHEGVGKISAVGESVNDLHIGQRVVISIVAPCLRCYWCIRGQHSLCREGLDRSRPKGTDKRGRPVHGHAGLGTFADQAVVARAHVVPTTSELPASQLAMLSCGFTTGFCAVVRSSRARAGATVAVFGLGGVGLAAVQGARLLGAAEVIVVDPVPFKRDSALALGATTAIDDTVQAVEAILDLTGGRGVDVAFDAIGHDDVASSAYRATRRGGQLVLIGGSLGSGPRWSFNDQMLSSKEVSGTFYGGAFPQRDIPEIIRLAEAGRVDLASMVSDAGGLDQIGDAIRALRSGAAIKPVITF